jgi:3-methyladenine DNA glycosylase AlkD
MPSAPAEQIVHEMRALAKPSARESMARFGIDTSTALGLNVPTIRSLAKLFGKNQPLAESLWNTGIHEARILACLVGDPCAISRSTMDRWVRDLSSWDVCDFCGSFFSRTPVAWQKIPKWAAGKPEFVRRAGFSTLASAAVHDKAAPDERFLESLDLIERYAFDERNFVRKAVNWALRNIGKRNDRLLAAAVACAGRIRTQDSKAARWIAADALREFRRKYGNVIFGPDVRIAQ